MLRIPGMPFLPGLSIRDVTKTSYPRVQMFTQRYGLNMLTDKVRPESEESSNPVMEPECMPRTRTSAYPYKSGSKIPAWMAYDKETLCFHGYFKETLPEVNLAPFQVRKVKILYYLQDGTLQIVEPKVENSGIPQGCLVSRQRVPKARGCSEYLTFVDLNVNQSIEIFDRVYHITNCDKYTRLFLNKSGVRVPDPVEEPSDPTTLAREKAQIKPLLPAHTKNQFAQFLEFDRKVLRFQAFWDDRTIFGDIRHLEFCYYLADDTIDIKESYVRNSGRDGPRTFLKRGKLPKFYEGLPRIGEEAPRTVLNVITSFSRGTRYCEDPLDMGRRDVVYYKDNDLQIGATVNVYGRLVVLTDCDEFTKSFYKKKYGIEDFTPIPTPIREEDIIPEQKIPPLPPYNGWGTYEDSEGNCLSILPKPPPFDFKKFIDLDRFVLRYGAKLLSTIKENCERIFIVSYFLSDDTIQVFEVAKRNSGFTGGDFIKRSRILVPGQKVFVSSRPVYYQPIHFYIGATVTLFDHIFTVVSADEYTLCYMEHHLDRFPMSNISLIMDKVRESLKTNCRTFLQHILPEGITDINDVCFTTFDKMKDALIKTMGDNISNHEIVTICRHFSADKAPPSECNKENVQAAVRVELKRYLWNAMDELKEHIYHINPHNKLYIPEMKLKSTITGCRLPLSQDLIISMLSVLNRNDCGDIELSDFYNFVDPNCTKGPDTKPVNIAFELCPKIPFLHKGRSVNLRCFIENLSLEEEVTTPAVVEPENPT